MVGKLPPLYLFIRMHFCSTSPNDSIIITKVINHISFHKVVGESGHRVSPSRARLISRAVLYAFLLLDALRQSLTNSIIFPITWDIFVGLFLSDERN